MSETVTKDFDYIKTAEKLADAFRELAKFDTIERAKSSPLMDDAEAVYKTCPTLKDFFICVGVALTFNMAEDAPDHVTDDISDDYLSKHPGKT
jgi:hypothetical protein